MSTSVSHSMHSWDSILYAASLPTLGFSIGVGLLLWTVRQAAKVLSLRRCSSCTRLLQHGRHFVTWWRLVKTADGRWRVAGGTPRGAALFAGRRCARCHRFLPSLATSRDSSYVLQHSCFLWHSRFLRCVRGLSSTTAASAYELPPTSYGTFGAGLELPGTALTCR